MVDLVSEYKDIFHYFLVHYYSFGFARSKTAPQMAHHLIGVFGEVHFANRQDGFKTVICEQMERNKLMPYQKRVEIPLQCIKHYSDSGIVLDVFGGSGTTMIACEKIIRSCYMIELDPKNCDIIIKRWEDFTGKKAIKIS
jgi:DNA modification methylase